LEKPVITEKGEEVKVCSVCGRVLEGDGTMNRRQYFHPPDTVAACLNGEWKPITPQQLADELAALRELANAAYDYFVVADDRTELVDLEYRKARSKFLSARAKVTT